MFHTVIHSVSLKKSKYVMKETSSVLSSFSVFLSLDISDSVSLLMCFTVAFICRML